jgi:hypothetical protein
MSYIQIEIGGKQRGLKFSQGTDMLLRSKLKGLTEDQISAVASYRVVWAGLEMGCLFNEQEIDFTFQDVSDWVEKISAEELNKVLDAYNKLQEYTKEIPEKDKKKLKKEIIKQTVTESPAVG